MKQMKKNTIKSQAISKQLLLLAQNLKELRGVFVKIDPVA